jgi:hypothetical protein
MIGLSWELLGYVLLFQGFQTIVIGAMIALLLWHGKRVNDRRQQVEGEPA